jgi:MFS family permease
VLVSPFLGPFIACWIVGHSTWRWAFWSLAILNAVAWLLVIFFMDETFYPRHLSPGKYPVRKSRILRVLGIEQWKTNLVPNTFLQAGMRSWTAITKLPVFLACVYYFMTFAWVIGVNITIGVFIIPAYKFTFDNLGKLVSKWVGLECFLLTGDSSHVSCSDHRKHPRPICWPLAT